MAYRLTDRKSRAKAMLAAVAATAVIGAGIITGLNVEMVGRAIERLETFDIARPIVPPPPPPPPPPQRAGRDEGAPAAPEASPIVAPEPQVQLPTDQPIAAAPEPGTGFASTIGQGGVGTGTGAGGLGTGAGIGTGTGAGIGSRPGRLVRNLTNADYRGLTGGRIDRGSAALALEIDPGGRVGSCRVVRSSGDSVVDQGICGVVSRRLRFDPARDPQGRPIPWSTNYMANWDRR
jgi:periplasmic protein TonB